MGSSGCNCRRSESTTAVSFFSHWKVEVYPDRPFTVGPCRWKCLIEQICSFALPTHSTPWIMWDMLQNKPSPSTSIQLYLYFGQCMSLPVYLPYKVYLSLSVLFHRSISLPIYHISELRKDLSRLQPCQYECISALAGHAECGGHVVIWMNNLLLPSVVRRLQLSVERLVGLPPSAEVESSLVFPRLETHGIR